ncbi:MarR family transcriptional regulator [Clostridium aestuarii]|uniref:MarR family transcriptional regulator n=1 Tax=Clostridium aestuarii TaxID=338193 RepID=A0ABT4CX73_9CLOT|nr:MarR family transcriptional regulator [Clostridium aestuarii]MCY6482947.1 MarR family transcriptional regulator [Clostridium aestuarii]
MKNIENLVNAYDWLDDVSTRIMGNFIKTTFLIDKIFDMYYKKIGLSKTQFQCLYLVYLVGDEGIALSELGSRMCVTKANMTSLVDRMQSKGLIYRVNNPEDRRSIKTMITKEGKKVLNEVLPEYKKFSSEIMMFLTIEEKQMTNDILEKIQKYLIDVNFK